MTDLPAGPPGAVHDAFEKAAPMIVLLGGDPLCVTACNAAARTRLGVGVGTAASDALTGEDLDELAVRLPELVASGTSFTAAGVAVPLLDERGGRAAALVDVHAEPVRAPDGTVGGLSVSWVETRPSTEERDERVLFASLQDVMMSEGLPVPRGVDLAASYLLAENRGGGDWFDAIVLDDGRLVLVVGDVVGHGLAATAVMSELRAIFDEQVRATADLAAALVLMDRRAQRSPATRAATICAALLDPATGAITYCTAGHAPPLVVSATGRASYLPPSGGSPLAMGRPFPVAEHVLDPGDLLVLYSDGLVVHSGRAPEESSLDLIQHAEAAYAVSTSPGGASADDGTEAGADVGRHTERFTAGLLGAATRHGYADDVTILTARLTDPVAPLSLSLPAAATTPSEVRHRLGDWLAGLRVRPLDESAVQHSVSELVCNAVEHAYPDPGAGARADAAGVELVAEHTPDGSLEVTVTDHGTWREPTPETDRGRGLAMVRGFSDDLEISTGPDGTRARLRHRPTWDAALLTGTTLGSSEHGLPDLEVERPRAGLLVLRGGIEGHAVDRLRHLLGQHSQGGAIPLLVDLTEVTSISSAAIHVLSTSQTWPADLRLLAPVGSPSQQMLDQAGLPHLSSLEA